MPWRRRGAAFTSLIFRSLRVKLTFLTRVQISCILNWTELLRQILWNSFVTGKASAALWSCPAQASALPTELDLVLSLRSLGWALCRVRRVEAPCSCCLSDARTGLLQSCADSSLTWLGMCAASLWAAVPSLVLKLPAQPWFFTLPKKILLYRWKENLEKNYTLLSQAYTVM